MLAKECPFTGRLIVYRCYYASGIRASQWAQLMKKGRLPRTRVPLISDHDSQARAECEAAGILTARADKEVETGLEAVSRLISKKFDDGSPGVVFVCDGHNDPVLGQCDTERILWEGEQYHYAPAREGRPDPKDVPVKKDDHSLDALRYLVVAWEKGRGGPPRPPGAQRRRKNIIEEGFAARMPRKDSFI